MWFVQPKLLGNYTRYILRIVLICLATNLGFQFVVVVATNNWSIRQRSVFPAQKWPEADFHIVPDAGHSAKEPGTTSLLVEACDKYKTL